MATMVDGDAEASSLPAACFHVLEWLCAANEMDVPEGLPQNPLQLRHVLCDEILQQADLYGSTTAWHHPSAVSQMDLHQYITLARRNSFRLGTPFLHVFAGLLKQWSSEASLQLGHYKGRLFFFEGPEFRVIYVHIYIYIFCCVMVEGFGEAR